MQDHLGVRVDRLGGVVAVVDQAGQVAEAGGLPFRPQHAAVDFIPHLHPLDRDAIGFQVVEDAVGVAVDVAVQLRQRVAGPRRRLGLLARIGPAVAVVEVDQDALSLGGGTLGLVQHIGAIVPAAAGVDPHPQPDRVHAQVLQQQEGIGLHAAAVVERVTARLLLADPADIGAVGKRGATRGQGERQPARRQQQSFEFHIVSSF
ncbi:conserved hypothetical protein [Ricinus communis]|uniref:Uncharacterized protein n=1 Tax=Ricinus communis TaxID=3988 RepID=B9TFH5_RICCO|nr:conserved hypothetical protein [Ricinus communis]